MRKAVFEILTFVLTVILSVTSASAWAATFREVAGPKQSWMEEAMLGAPLAQHSFSASKARELQILAPELFVKGFTDERGIEVLTALSLGHPFSDFESRPEVDELLEQWKTGLERRKFAAKNSSILQRIVGFSVNKPGVALIVALLIGGVVVLLWQIILVVLERNLPEKIQRHMESRRRARLESEARREVEKERLKEKIRRESESKSGRKSSRK